jgi:ectoine hydroxylase-related dioxygenase (phytanoyl-CoA dioxygenase family)
MTTTTAGRPFSTDELQRYGEDGYILIPDLLPASAVDFFHEHESRQADDGPRGLQSHRQDDGWSAIARHPEVVTKVRQLLDGQPLIVQTMYMAKKPAGGTGVALHQDTHYIRNEPNTLMACWIAFNDTGADNGGLCVVPGSHKRGLLEAGEVRESDQHTSWENDYDMKDQHGKQWTETMQSHDIHEYTRDQVKMLTVPKGGGVFFSSLTVHGSYANQTDDKPRLAFATHYVRDDTWVFREDLQGMVSAQA